MTRDEFTRRFRAATEGLNVRLVASRLRTSLPTVERWRAGDSAPHRFARENIIELALKLRRDVLGDGSVE